MNLPSYECLDNLSQMGWIHHLRCSEDGTVLSDIASLFEFLHLPIEKTEKLSIFSLITPQMKSAIEDLLSSSKGKRVSLEIYSQLPPFPKTKVYDVICIKKDRELSLFMHSKELENAHITSHRIMDLGLLTAGFFHDFNNHLTSLTFFCETLNEDNLSEKKGTLKEKLKLLAEQSHHIISYIKSDNSVQKKTSARKGLLSTSKMFKLSLPSSISIKEEILDSDTYIPLSSGAFSHVLLNLLSNAKEALEGQGSIYIKSYIDNDALKIVISDTGKGVKKEFLPYLFSPFFSEKKTDSNGLGLAISKQLIELAGGDIECTSAPNEGATFTISLPIIS